MLYLNTKKKTAGKLKVSSVQTLMTFHYTDWFIGMFIIYIGLLYSPYNWVGFHPLYQTTNQGPLNTAQVTKQVYLQQTMPVSPVERARNARGWKASGAVRNEHQSR